MSSVWWRCVLLVLNWCGVTVFEGSGVINVLSGAVPLHNRWFVQLLEFHSGRSVINGCEVKTELGGNKGEKLDISGLFGVYSWTWMFFYALALQIWVSLSQFVISTRNLHAWYIYSTCVDTQVSVSKWEKLDDLLVAIRLLLCNIIINDTDLCENNDDVHTFLMTHVNDWVNSDLTRLNEIGF